MKKDTVVVDIDGCINHYPDSLKMWAEVFLNLDETESKLAIEKDNDFDLLKKTYRHSEILSYLLPREGVSETLQKMRKSGWVIVVLTSRNPLKNPKIEAITKDWLNKYNIPFDSIVFTKDKAEYVKNNEDRIIMVVEDDPNFLDSFKHLKTEVVALKNDLNVGIRRAHFHTVSSWWEIAKFFDTLVKKH